MAVATRIGTFLKKTLIGKGRNLVSLEDPFDKMRSLLRDRRVTGVLDAGASDGRVSKRLMARFPEARAYAFEPNRLYRAKLLQYAKEEPRFHPCFAALSDRKGRAALNLTVSPGSTSLLTPGERMLKLLRDNASVESSAEVELTTIDEWVQSNGNPPIHLMKFDIQGAELKALRGAVRTLRDSTLLVYTEVWFNPGYEGGALYSDIDLFLRSNNFVLYDIFKPKYDSGGGILWGNAMFVHAERVKI